MVSAISIGISSIKSLRNFWILLALLLLACLGYLSTALVLWGWMASKSPPADGVKEEINICTWMGSDNCCYCEARYRQVLWTAVYSCCCSLIWVLSRGQKGAFRMWGLEVTRVLADFRVMPFHLPFYSINWKKITNLLQRKSRNSV